MEIFVTDAAALSVPLAAGDTILENRTGDFTERFVPDGMPFVLTRSGDGLVTARRRAQFPPVATNGVEDEAVGFAEQIPALVFTLRFSRETPTTSSTSVLQAAHE